MQFTVDLDIKGVILLSIMALATGITIFYLGVIFGKASRQPNLQPDQPNLEEKAATGESDLSIPKDLEVFDINDSPQQMEKLKENVQKALKKTDTVIRKTQEQEKPAAPVVRPGKEQEGKKWPEQKTTVSKPTNNIYTIQVFVTKSKEKANILTKQLRQKEFDAYVQEVKHENQKLYKIRVGRMSKEKIGELKEKLQKVVGGMGMGLNVVKIG